MGFLFEAGNRVPKDFVQAHMWFTLAVDRGHIEAKEFQDDLATKMTPEQIAKAQEIAREWQPK